MQRVRDPILDGVLRGRQRLSQHLPTENLGTADIPTVTAKYVVFDALELQQRYQVLEDGMHLETVTAINLPCGRRRPPRRCR